MGLVVASVVAAAFVAVLAATSGEEGSTPSAVTTIPAPVTTLDPQEATKAAVLDAYRNSFEAFVAVASDPALVPMIPVSPSTRWAIRCW